MQQSFKMMKGHFLWKSLFTLSDYGINADHIIFAGTTRKVSYYFTSEACRWLAQGGLSPIVSHLLSNFLAVPLRRNLSVTANC